MCTVDKTDRTREKGRVEEGWGDGVIYALDSGEGLGGPA
jgi:hypothetical protein